jgi:hypothetical protein
VSEPTTDETRKVICLHCDESFYYPKESRKAQLEAWRLMLDHDAACVKNPIVRANAALVAALQEMVGLFDPEGLPEDDAVFQAYHKAQVALQQAGITEG